MINFLYNLLLKIGINSTASLVLVLIFFSILYESLSLISFTLSYRNNITKKTIDSDIAKIRNQYGISGLGQRSMSVEGLSPEIAIKGENEREELAANAIRKLCKEKKYHPFLPFVITFGRLLLIVFLFRDFLSVSLNDFTYRSLLKMIMGNQEFSLTALLIIIASIICLDLGKIITFIKTSKQKDANQKINLLVFIVSILFSLLLYVCMPLISVVAYVIITVFDLITKTLYKKRTRKGSMSLS